MKIKSHLVTIALSFIFIINSIKTQTNSTNSTQNPSNTTDSSNNSTLRCSLVGNVLDSVNAI